MNWTLEVVVVPVSDVDRATATDLAVSIKGGFGRGTNQAFDKLERHLATY